MSYALFCFGDEMTSYLEKLKDPRWQRKRLEILERDKWRCQSCYDSKSTLHIHHKHYEKGKDPWEYSKEDLITLCGFCHEHGLLPIDCFTVGERIENLQNYIDLMVKVHGEDKSELAISALNDRKKALSLYLTSS